MMSSPAETADAPAISVVVSTYNRADRLALALNALRAQTGSVPFEVIIVDNNSTDDTTAVVRRIVATDSRLRYAFEPRQGLSYGRNTGIALARGPIIAFSDDDVRVAEDWIEELKRTFDAHPEIDYVGGRVLPCWLQPPPAWLTSSHWSPLAVQDYGSEPVVSGPEHAVCLVGASLAFRRTVFDRVGLFAHALGRIKDGIGSTEDHEMQLGVWRAGMRGLYAPSVLAMADVTVDRLSRKYHRRWHTGHGRHCAMMRLREFVPSDLGPLNQPKDLVMLFGSPAFVYSELLRCGQRWTRAVVRREDALFYAHQIRHLLSYIRTRATIHSAETGRGVIAEVTSFVRAYAAKRARRRSATATPTDSVGSA
jgi:glycosyltransferase involved in cell wall biosynthesis